MTVLYLDRYHLGDPLFLNRLARDLAAFQQPILLVHGPGEDAERALEAEGRLPEWRGSVLAVGTPEEAETVGRAARGLNRRIAHALNEAGVAAVRLDGGSRGLLRAGAGGSVEEGEAGWLSPLVRQGAVPVVAALVPDPAGVHQVDAGAVVAVLAGALGEEGGAPATAVFLKRGGELERDGERLREAALEDVPQEALPEPVTVRAALDRGARAVLSTVSGLRPEGVVGTRITARVTG